MLLYAQRVVLHLGYLRIHHVSPLTLSHQRPPPTAPGGVLSSFMLLFHCAFVCPRFVPEKFEELFSKFDGGSKGGLTLGELLEMTEANRNVMDFFGW